MTTTNPSSEFSQREHLFAVQLHQLLVTHFSLEELRTLCFEINFNYDDLGGEGINAKVRELVSALQRKGQLSLLAAAASKQRPNTAWPNLAPPEAESPYRGLHAFREQDEHLFFGRELFSRRLLEMVSNYHLVTVIGSSGSGKSSVVYAGLLPKLRQQGNWLIAQCRPGRDPVYNLAKALVDVGDKDKSRGQKLREIRDLAEQLGDQEDPLPLMDIVNDILPQDNNTRLLLFVDQFEELYTLLPEQVSQHQFLDLLIKALPDNEAENASSLNLYPNRFHLILTLRADFLGQALDYRPFADALQDRDLKLGPMNRVELERVIVQPAAVLGVGFEAGLVSRILDEVADQRGSLPLLEFALQQLWEWQSSKSLTHVAYEAIGQVKGALVGHAEQVYARLNETEQVQAKQILVQLVKPGLGTEDTRQQATRADLGEEAWSVVQRLATVDARLLVTTGDETGQEAVDLAHEALIRSWDRLQNWINADREFLIWRERLRFSMRQWEYAKRDEGGLIRGVTLNDARKWLEERADDLSGDEQDYIQISIGVVEREVAERKKAKKNQLRLEIIAYGGGGRNLSEEDLSEADLREANLRGADLRGADLRRASLRDAHLSRADLRGADLRGADLRGADLHGAQIDEATQFDDRWRLVWEIINQGAVSRDLARANLSGATLIEVNLSRANLLEANLSRANLSYANLRRADLSYANLRRAELGGADLRGANLRGSQIDEVILIDTRWYLIWEIVNQGAVNRDLRGADLRGADLREANLHGANLHGANLHGADLRGADLHGANLRGTKIDEATKINDRWRLIWEVVNQGAGSRDLVRADLRGADLRRADLRFADLRGADLRKADLRKANLSDADLRKADLRKADLHEADLRRANLRGTQIDEATKINDRWRLIWEVVNQGAGSRDLVRADLRFAGLREVDLSKTDLHYTNLFGANLYGANLRGADLSGADLYGAYLRSANLRNADLRGADLRGTDLRGAQYTTSTTWPETFDPTAAGAILVEE